MKKSLIALAVASVFIAPAALAQVTIYGKANMSLDAHDSGAATEATKTTVSATGSRLGFRISEKLSDDLSINVGIETAIDFSNVHESSTIPGTSTKERSVFGERGAGVTLSSKSMGSVGFGYGGAPIKGATRGLDLFDLTVGENAGLMNNTKFFNNNAPDGFGYTSPSINGLVVTIASDATSSTSPSAGSPGKHILAQYKAGPFFALIGSAIKRTDSATEYKTTTVGGSATMGDLTLIALFDANSNTTNITTVTDYNASYLAAKYNISKTDAVKLAITTVGDYTSGGVTTVNGKQQMVLGFDRNLSKDTKVYALYSKVSANNTATLDPTIISIGVQKNF